jgi:hypothetical protein
MWSKNIFKLNTEWTFNYMFYCDKKDDPSKMFKSLGYLKQRM